MTHPTRTLALAGLLALAALPAAAERALTLSDFVGAQQEINRLAHGSARAQAQYELDLAQAAQGDGNSSHAYARVQRSLEIAQAESATAKVEASDRSVVGFSGRGADARGGLWNPNPNVDILRDR